MVLFGYLRKTGVLSLLLVASVGAVHAQETTQDRPILLALSLDGNHYLTSTGGRTANGCEAWLTMLSSGESVYVARCDQARLSDLKLRIESVLQRNRQLDTIRRVKPSEEAMMIDLADFKLQALLGHTANDAIAYVFMDNDDKLAYYRVEGSPEQLEELGFEMDALFRANETVNPAWKIVSSGSRHNVAERANDRAQMLIGTSGDGASVALVLDADGRTIQVITE